MAHAPAPPPLKLRLRPRKTEASAAPLPDRQRIAKRATATARGTKRRRRAPDEGAGRQESDPHDVESDLENPEDGAAGARENVVADEQQPLLTTPKRARIAPEVLPLGLERGDYHALHGPRAGQNDKSVEGIEQAENRDGEAAWTAEDDRILVELVLEKLKLSKLDWQECARSLGKDRGSVGRRWKSLMVNGDIGLKRSSGRSNIHGTWR